MKTNTALVIGAGGGLGQAIVKQLLAQNIHHVWAVSRHSITNRGPRFEFRQSDYSTGSIKQVCDDLKQRNNYISRVIICNGTLHGEDYFPEKRIESIDPTVMLEIYRINAVVPMLWVRGLLPVLAGNDNCVLSVLSARVGSISDNRLGGWYSYRASKAALNMLLKTASIEYSRRAANVKLLAFHPGTTDTALSKPFQDTVPEGKLFTPDFVAKRVLELMTQSNKETGLEFIDWDGKTIQW